MVSGGPGTPGSLQEVRMRKLVWALLALAAVPLHAEQAERGDLSDSGVSLRLNADLVGDLGGRVAPAARADGDGYSSFKMSAAGRMQALATNSVFRTVESGELRLATGPTLTWKGDSAGFRGASLRPGTEPSTVAIAAADGTARV